MQRCGRSVRQCSLVCDTHDMCTSQLRDQTLLEGEVESRNCQVQEGQCDGPSPGVSSRYHHTNLESTDRAREERGILGIHYRMLLLPLWYSVGEHLCILAPLSTSATASEVAMPFLVCSTSHLSLISSPRGCSPGLGVIIKVTCVYCFQILHATRTNTSATETVSLQGGKKDTHGRMMLMAPKRRGNAFALHPA